MKGFKKNGKFRPTQKRTKSALTKSDLQNFETELDKGEQLLDQRDRLKKQDASSIQHDKLILAQKIKLNKLAKELKLKAREKRSLDDFDDDDHERADEILSDKLIDVGQELMDEMDISEDDAIKILKGHVKSKESF